VLIEKTVLIELGQPQPWLLKFPIRYLADILITRLTQYYRQKIIKTKDFSDFFFVKGWIPEIWKIPIYVKSKIL
jgi:phosphoenolpyruvate carboxylase